MRSTPGPRLPTRSVASAAALGLVLAACGGATETGPGAAGTIEAAVGEDDRLHVVATTSILGDIVGQLVGDDADVSVIMPAGADPHGFEPSAQDGAMLREADLVVANGLMLEENLLSVLDAVKEEGGNVFELADQLDPIDFDFHQGGDEDAHGHEQGAVHEDEHGHAEEDPHVWFDPVRMADGVDLIAAEIAAVDTALDDGEWMARADTYGEELLSVHEEMEAMFATIDDGSRRLVTNHEALGYLAARYDFEILGTVVPGSSTQADADPRGFSELVATVEEADVSAVFAENTDSTVLAEQLASEVIGRGDLEIEVVPVYTDALGEEGSGAETYLGLLRTTAQLITDALS